MLGLYDYELGSWREECPGSLGYVFLPRRYKKDHGRIFQVIGSEYETTVAVVSVVVDSGWCQAAFYQLAFQVVRYRTAPASVEDNVTANGFEVFRCEWGSIVETEGEGVLRKGPVLLQVHSGLEDFGEEGEVGQ